MRRFSAQADRFAVSLHVHRLPVYPVIHHRICLFKCQNLAAYAATDFDAQKQIPCGVFVFCAVHARAKMDFDFIRLRRTLRGILRPVDEFIYGLIPSHKWGYYFNIIQF